MILLKQRRRDHPISFHSLQNRRGKRWIICYVKALVTGVTIDMINIIGFE
jgi:hypothetical protein